MLLIIKIEYENAGHKTWLNFTTLRNIRLEKNAKHTSPTWKVQFMINGNNERPIALTAKKLSSNIFLYTYSEFAKHLTLSQVLNSFGFLILEINGHEWNWLAPYKLYFTENIQ